jgi:lysophospholipase L1-like esterase
MKRLITRLLLSLGVLAVLFGATELVLRSQGYGALPSIWFDPEVGTRFHPSQTRDIYAAGNKYMHSARINAIGLRGHEPDPAKDGDAGFRVVCLGDSFTFGWGVEDDETFPVQLERLLTEARGEPDADVINCGLPGYNTWQEHRIYEKLVHPMAPDVVVIGWYLNDLDPLSFGTTGTLAPLDHPLAGTALLDYWVRKLRAKQPEFVFDGFDQAAAEELKPYYDKKRGIVEHNSGHPTSRPYVERNLRDLRALFDAIEADGARPILLVFPSVGQVDALKRARADKTEAEYAADHGVIARIQSDLAAFSAERGVTVVDLLGPYMDSEIRPYGEIDQSHPSVHGYALAAEALVEPLAGEGQ